MTGDPVISRDRGRTRVPVVLSSLVLLLSQDMVVVALPYELSIACLPEGGVFVCLYGVVSMGEVFIHLPDRIAGQQQDLRGM